MGYDSALPPSVDSKRLFCPKPFDELEIGWRGISRLCCFIERDVGSVVESLDDVLNSKAAIEIRNTIVAGTFDFCDKKSCPFWVSSSLKTQDQYENTRYDDFINGSSLLVDTVDLNISFDTSCNLRCVSCRAAVNKSTWEEKKHGARLMKVVEKSLYRIRKLHLCGSGDPFASSLLRGFLMSVDSKSYPHLEISLLTNGILLDQKMWEQISPAHSAISSIQISVDAATGATYEKVRRQGSFERLQKNLNFVSELRRRNEIGCFIISFVVSKMNYQEMKAFVEMGETLGCDQILFSHIRDWGALTRSRYVELAVHRPNNPLHEELVEILGDSVFSRERVFLGNLSALRKAM